MTRASSVAVVLGGIALAMGLPAPVQAARVEPGELDKSFGKGGKVTTRLGSRVFAADVARAPAGGAYVAANTGPPGPNLSGGRLVVLRYDRRGRPARGFGKRGVANLSLRQGPATVKAMAVQPDGRLLLVGSVRGRDVVLVRLTRTGRLDRSFAGDGVQVADFGSSFERATDVAVQPDGGVVLIGSIGTIFPASGTVGDGFVARYRRDGSVDAQFGDGGRVILRRPRDDGYLDAQGLELLDDGAILVGGNSGVVHRDTNVATVALLRLDGSPDPRLGPEGIAYPGLGNGIVRDLVVDHRSGRIYLAGSAVPSSGGGAEFFLLALRPDLARDESFGEFGVARSSLPGGSEDSANTAVVDGRGRIVLAGTALSSTTPKPRGSFALARFLPTGTLDRAFRRRGWVRTSFDRGWNVARALLRQPRGRLLAVGSNASNELGETAPAITLARYRIGR
jgi:uncharacterized delta-60 repeat protein